MNPCSVASLLAANISSIVSIEIYNPYAGVAGILLLVHKNGKHTKRKLKSSLMS
jgi:hypothetical protein